MSTPSEPPRGQKLTGVRRVIADRMLASLATSAQLTFHTDVDVTAVLDRREALKLAGRRISLEDCAIHTLARVLRAYPQFNGVMENDRIVLDDHVQVAVAISAQAMLMTPVIRDADLKSIDEIATARADMVDRARRGELRVSEMKGGTVTVSNLGMAGVRHFTPILNGGQFLLLGIGRIDDRLGRDAQGGVSDRKLLNLSLTADHRIVDGADAGEFLDAFCKHLATFDLAQ